MPDLLHFVGWNQLVAALMGLAVWLACRTRFLSRRPAACHALWLLVLLKLVTPPILGIPLLPAYANTDAGTAGPACECRTGSGHGAVTAPSPPRSFGSGAVGMGLLGISLLVSSVFWIAAALRLIQMRRLLRGSDVISGRATELLREVSQRFHLKSTLDLQLVDAPVTPMLWAGSSRPIIVLPRQLADSLSDDALRSIFAHELGHYLRRDHWAGVFSFAVTTLFWWNPLVWIARRELAAAAEHCCDAVVLERLSGSRKTYARTLLTVVDSVTPGSAGRSVFGVTFGESQSLRRRFELIADAGVRARLPRGGWILLAIACATLLLVPARTAITSSPRAISPARESGARASLDHEVKLPESCCCPS